MLKLEKKLLTEENKMAFCSKCGATIPAGQTLCSNCASGASVNPIPNTANPGMTSMNPGVPSMNPGMNTYQPVPMIDPMIEAAREKMSESDFIMYQSIRNIEKSTRVTKIWSIITGICMSAATLFMLILIFTIFSKGF